MASNLGERQRATSPFNFYIDPDTLVGFIGLLERSTVDEADEVVFVAEGDLPMQIS